MAYNPANLAAGKKPFCIGPIFGALLSGFVLFFSHVGLWAGDMRFLPHRDGKSPPDIREAMAKLEDGFLAVSGFSSHLPILVLEEGETDGGENQFSLEVINGPEPLNILGSNPDFTAMIRLGHISRDPVSGGKGSFQLESRHGEKLEILGLPADSKWFLLGSSFDKTMLRAYLALVLGAGIMPDLTPEFRFCELLLAKDGAYQYQGVYLLSEDPVHRLGFSGASLKKGAYLLEYGRSETGRAAAAKKAGPQDRFTILAAAAGATPENIIEDLKELEECLYADDLDEFFRYLSLLDITSFIDAYILNDSLMNYQVGDIPVYLYKNKGKLRIAPVWRFEQAIDNTPESLSEKQMQAMRFQALNRLFKSADFIDDYRSRFYSLHGKLLEPAKIQLLVDEVAIFLGPAMLRDWARWEDVYTRDERFALKPRLSKENGTLVRRTFAYSHELIKIKSNLRAHDFTVRQRLLEMKWEPGLFRSADRVKRGALMSVLFLAAFFGVVAYARARI